MKNFPIIFSFWPRCRAKNMFCSTFLFVQMEVANTGRKASALFSTGFMAKAPNGFTTIPRAVYVFLRTFVFTDLAITRAGAPIQTACPVCFIVPSTVRFCACVPRLKDLKDSRSWREKCPQAERGGAGRNILEGWGREQSQVARTARNSQAVHPKMSR